MTLRECWDRHQCLKSVHQYERVYEPIFSPIRNEPLRILEIGIWKGASVWAWLDYFPNATIYCLDTFQRKEPERVEVLKHERVRWAQGDSTIFANLSFRQEVDGQIDFVIDDGCHLAEAQRKTYLNWHHVLKPEGMYFIEDVWPDEGRAKRPCFDELVAALPETAVHHDLRKHTGKPDSYLIQI